MSLQITVKEVVDPQTFSLAAVALHDAYALQGPMPANGGAFGNVVSRQDYSEIVTAKAVAGSVIRAGLGGIFYLEDTFVEQVNSGFVIDENGTIHLWSGTQFAATSAANSPPLDRGATAATDTLDTDLAGAFVLTPTGADTTVTVTGSGKTITVFNRSLTNAVIGTNFYIPPAGAADEPSVKVLTYLEATSEWIG